MPASTGSRRPRISGSRIMRIGSMASGSSPMSRRSTANSRTARSGTKRRSSSPPWAASAGGAADKKGAAEAAPSWSNRLQIRGRDLAGAGIALRLEAHALALIEIADARAFDSRDVDENVLRAVLGLDEAKALGRVEPFNGTDRHICNLPWMNRRCALAQRIKQRSGRTETGFLDAEPKPTRNELMTEM